MSITDTHGSHCDDRKAFKLTAVHMFDTHIENVATVAAVQLIKIRVAQQ